MKKLSLLLPIVFALSLAGCAQKNDNAYCETLTSVECMDEQGCELCGESRASSFISCHSEEFCENIPPVGDQGTPPAASQGEDGQNTDGGNLTPKLEEITQATTTDETNQATTTDETTGSEDDDITQEPIQELEIDDFIKEMKKNETLRNYLKNECLEGEIRCPDGIYYQWTRVNEVYTIAFISNRAEQEKKDDAFKYSTEIFKVNLKTGEVQRQQDGSFKFEANLY